MSGQSWITFEGIFLKDFFDVHYLPVYLDYLVSGRVKDYMKNILHAGPIAYNAKENEIHFYYYDSLIAVNPEVFYNTIVHGFNERPLQKQFSAHEIGETQMKLLENIKNELNRQHTKYRVIVSPAYDQVFDFSGINPITQDYRNYYDPRHYRYLVAQQIMDSAYATR